MKKKINAVEMVRAIRDRLYKDTQRMTKSEKINFYRQKAKEFYIAQGVEGLKSIRKGTHA